MRVTSARGFTLIELLITVAIVGIVAAIGLPGLLRARVAANESSTIGSLRAINSAQMAFAASCGHGAFAETLVILGTPPFNDAAYLSPDITASVNPVKSGYVLAMGGTPVGGLHPPACNGGAMIAGYYVTAEPEAPGASGVRYFWINTLGTVFTQVAPFVSTDEQSPPSGDPGATPIQ